MGGRLNSADFTLRAACDHGKSSLHRRPFEVWINFEVAEEFFGYHFLPLAVVGLQVRSRAQTDLGNCSRKFWRVSLGVWNGAGHRVNDDVLRSGIILGGVGVGDVQN